MFDIGFWEMAVIAVVALVVIGPERLPKVASTAGRWFGKARYFISSVKADIDREIKAEELKSVIKEQSESVALHEIYEETQSAINEAKVDEPLTGTESIAQNRVDAEHNAELESDAESATSEEVEPRR